MSKPIHATDLLCLTPHSDDAEIALGATLRRLTDRGHTVWVCDLTRGELGSNATPDERWREAQAAAEILGLTGRIQLALPDGFVSREDPAQVGAVTAIIRHLRPRWIVCAPDPRRHPDHVATPPLVIKAAYLARLQAYQPAIPELRVYPGTVELPALAERWEAEAIFTVCPVGETPSLIFDGSDSWAAKEAAIAAFSSQFQRQPDRVASKINDPNWLAKIERRGRFWGYRAGVVFGEALRAEDAVPIYDDLPDTRWS
ncbi:MAG: bacillithiol biosynthesis deacetylase BshB1 [bacterium]